MLKRARAMLEQVFQTDAGRIVLNGEVCVLGLHTVRCRISFAAVCMVQLFF